MGASVGAAFRRAGIRVVWAGDERSDATRTRALDSDLTDVCTVANVARDSDVIVSLCPPAAARDLANAVAAARFEGIYIDANAISPATAREVERAVTEHGATYVDGSVIGAPVSPGGSTRLYLSGRQAGEVAALFAADDPTVVVLGDDATAASALKMCNAAWTKASSAALLTIWATAHAAGVWEALQQEWGRGNADLLARIDQLSATTPARAWRFVGEMEEIARTFDDAGLPGGFAGSAAEIYRRLEEFKDRGDPDRNAVLGALLDPEDN